MKKKTEAVRRPEKKPKGPAKKKTAKRKKQNGTRNKTVKTNQWQFCPRCGAALLPWQRFCADCGANLHRRFLKEPPEMLYADGEAFPDAVSAEPKPAAEEMQMPDRQTRETGPGQVFSLLRFRLFLHRMTKFGFVGIAEAAAILLLTAAVLFAAISRASFGGSYSLITDGAAQLYIFDDAGGYVYTDADGKTQNGTYLRIKNKIALTDAEGHKSELLHKGSVLCPESARYDNKYVRSDREQTLTRVISLMYDGGTLRTTRTLELRRDHTCRIEVVTTFIGEELEEPIIREGTYRRWGSKLILRWDDGFTETERLVNGYLYYNIYQKQSFFG